MDEKPKEGIIKPEEMDGFFSVDPKKFALWKTRTYHQCKTAGMSLWMGLQNAHYMISAPIIRVDELLIDIGCGIKMPTYHEVTERMRTKFKTFPYKVEQDCRCQNCRYHRIFRGK